ncbi:phycoerythrobilin:ferredoxin oxidoreductase [Chamaesiphon polymorphus]|uniref:Phycoerythrobilin:ferredoxin oxidoreductase n=1 Tax=Chamaesiphon polymorphus CCALA 037 TaxID=2107692 RepID=A0A2T1GIH4_9CYAN|nr:phycoerythrobilin:ferredoxin oxidoreductase [Chamaesiphon polymorphus]PSB57435.1 phycoerythrobilin:ferredoxin oxidoreductase [Chamaesiphon polymorphus CCALA 037]
MTLYQPFLEYAIELIQQRLELQSYPIPAGFEHKSAIVGKGKQENEVVTTSYGYQSPKLRQIRAAHVQGGNALQVLNFVIFPHLNYDLPFFGADLVTLPGGHLIALDMQPLFRDDREYQAKYSDPILPIFETYQQHLPWGGDFPEEASAFFSPAFLWTRPKEHEAVETHVFEAFKAYLQAYLDFVDRAEPVTEPQALAAIKQSQLRYLRYRAEKDPARGMFNRFYGSEWTEEYIHGFLFDLERQLETADSV